jgi:hypothetical protein
MYWTNEDQKLARKWHIRLEDDAPEELPWTDGLALILMVVLLAVVVRMAGVKP